jgi:hypothetical protein
MTTDNHTHDWRLTESRALHEVEPPTAVLDWVCDYCGATKQTQQPRVL